MRRKIGAWPGNVLLVLLFVGMIFVPSVSAEKTGESWIDSFDRWVEPRDMSMYTREIIIEEPNCTISPEEVERTPWLVIIDKDTIASLFGPEMEVEFFSDPTVHVTVIDDSAGVVESAREDPDVAMKNKTVTWCRTQDTLTSISSISETLIRFW